MKSVHSHNYYVYITTNLNRTVVYTGVTNNLLRRINEHKKDIKNRSGTFASRYNATHLVYFEHFDYIKMLHCVQHDNQSQTWQKLDQDILGSAFAGTTGPKESLYLPLFNGEIHVVDGVILRFGIAIGYVFNDYHKLQITIRGLCNSINMNLTIIAYLK